MAVNFVELLDVDDNWHSVNVKQIARVSWGEIPDDEKRDMVYLTDNSEIALDHQSGSSCRLAQLLGISNLVTFLEDNEQDEPDEDDEDSDND